jgi:hypothetical protein
MIEDHSIVRVDVQEIDRCAHHEQEVAIIMYSVNPRAALEAARILVKRAGMSTRVFVVNDSSGQGFIRTVNAAASMIKAKHLAYMTDDVFPGIAWLKSAVDVLEQTGKGLLAFNCGRWGGRIAGFGLVRTEWVKSVYQGSIFFPGYEQNTGAIELTLIAQLMGAFAYEPDCTVADLDSQRTPERAGILERTSCYVDRDLFWARFHSGFDARFPEDQSRRHQNEYVQLMMLMGTGETSVPTTIVQRVGVEDLAKLSWRDPNGIAVVMPSIDVVRGLATARRLADRTGVASRIFVVEDTLRQGFVRTLNQTAAQLDVQYVIYLAEDAFPGIDWLKTAHAKLEQTGKGLLAFNCGKWRGRVAAFGMVRKAWAKRLYHDEALFYPGYNMHKADNELTVIARVTGQLVYDANILLLENDPNKVFSGGNPEDKALFRTRFRAGFDGLAPLEKLRPLAKSYFVPLHPPN